MDFKKYFEGILVGFQEDSGESLVGFYDVPGGLWLVSGRPLVRFHKYYAEILEGFWMDPGRISVLA